MPSTANIGFRSGRATRRMFVALGCLVACALGANAARAQAPAPRLEVDATEVNLGVMVRGQHAEGSFTLYNRGTAPLRIISADPG